MSFGLFHLSPLEAILDWNHPRPFLVCTRYGQFQISDFSPSLSLSLTHTPSLSCSRTHTHTHAHTHTLSLSHFLQHSNPVSSFTGCCFLVSCHQRCWWRHGSVWQMSLKGSVQTVQSKSYQELWLAYWFISLNLDSLWTPSGKTQEGAKWRNALHSILPSSS